MRYKRGEWSEGEVRILVNELGYRTNKGIGELIGRSAQQVGAKLVYMRQTGEDVPSVEEVNLIKEAKRVSDFNFIKDNPGMSTDRIAQRISRSESYVNKMRTEERKQESSQIRAMREGIEFKAKEEREQKRTERAIIEEEKEVKRIEYNKKRRLEREKAQEKERLLEEKEVQAIYDKMMAEDRVVAGVCKKDLRVRVGQTYQVKNMKKRTRQDKYFIGTAIQETKDHIIIRNKGRTESFLKVDFLIGEYQIKEVS